MTDDIAQQILAELRELRRLLEGYTAPAVTVKRAAEMLNCSRRRVFALLAERRLDRAEKLGKVTTVSAASVFALMDARAEPPAKVRRRRLPGRREKEVAEFRASFRTAT